VPDDHANATVHAWRVRDALRRPDWPAVRRFIQRMPADQASQPRWRYWYARALDATGKSGKGQAVFKETAGAFGYYGFLAADAIELAYADGDELPAPREEQEAAVRQQVRVQRGLLLHRAGDEATAIRVWRRAIDEFDQRANRLAAARLANAADWPWAAMYASGRAGYDGASPLRFPRSYQPLVQAAASTHGVPAPWIYALIRQESAFRNVACSSAGACGLTQLMPGTGRWMLERLGHDNSNLAASLARPERNIPAGTAYLAYLRDRFKHPVVALAAYNAGPTNVRRWLDEGGPPQGSARWIETLPFGETRDYTIHVLFNRAVYDLLANDRTQRLARVLSSQ
jgi:soluble lytic murein transglycosylase